MTYANANVYLQSFLWIIVNKSIRKIAKTKEECNGYSATIYQYIETINILKLTYRSLAMCIGNERNVSKVAGKF